MFINSKLHPYIIGNSHFFWGGYLLICLCFRVQNKQGVKSWAEQHESFAEIKPWNQKKKSFTEAWTQHLNLINESSSICLSLRVGPMDRYSVGPPPGMQWWKLPWLYSRTPAPEIFMCKLKQTEPNSTPVRTKMRGWKV